MQAKRWDIFCNVIDNFGDIGVCWRMARQLVAEHGRQVRLWVDDLTSFQAMCPDIHPEQPEQIVRGVFVRQWPRDFPDVCPEDIPEIVIEAFACELPETYLAAMASRPEKPRWINLEYLSAEEWVAGCHQQPSPHPKLPLTRHFFFPGFDPGTGGLLRESSLFERRDRWRKEIAQTDRGKRLGLPSAQRDELLVSLFCYENPALPALIQCWIEHPHPVHCLVPQGRALSQITRSDGMSGLTPGNTLRQGSLTLTALPFVPQEDYDLLLWHCDLNFVRGEDSFVRAQWAARPLIWHIYPQEEEAHLTKLSAFLERYGKTLENTSAQALKDFWQAWNGNTHPGKLPMGTAWQTLFDHLPALTRHAEDWCDGQARQADLATQLVRFCEKQI